MSKDPPVTPDRVFEMTMFAEHYQFYAYDSGADPGELSIYWDDVSKEDMVLITDHILGIATVRHLDVPVQVELYPKEPSDEALDEYDQVVQCSIKLPSGKLVVSGATEDMYAAQKFDVSPGTYGVRIYYGALEDVDSEGFEGEDFYKLSLWPVEEPPEATVIKLWDGRPKHQY
jgi:hypothetical protein